MGFKLAATQEVIITGIQDGNEYELKHKFDLRKFDVAYRRMQDVMVEASGGDRDKLQGEAVKAPMQKVVEIYDASIISISGYEPDDEVPDGELIPVENMIDYVPTDHKMKAIQPLMASRTVKNEEAKN